ncbi:MAG: glycoside hydrolase [Treponema sp.]|jgi:hypothetical protein|nr:glycoside hydrolase [Treponema sp.]
MYNFEYDLETSPITNCWETARTARLNTQEFEIFRGRGGASFNHAPFLAAVGSRIFATWSQGNRDEDALGQRVALSWSDDLGETWSVPEFIVNTEIGKFSTKVAMALGVRTKDRVMTAYYVSHEFPEEAVNPETSLAYDFAIGMLHSPVQPVNSAIWAKVSKDQGGSWSKPVKCIDRAGAYTGPEEIKGGRLIMPGANVFFYTDDPLGLSGWKRSVLPGINPDSQGIDRENWIGFPGRPHRGLCYMWNESSLFQTGDGVIHNMLRNGSHKNVFGVTESRDNGETWSEPKLTSYTDQAARPFFGQLPDGRFFGVTTPYPAWESWNFFYSSVRTPLVMAISEDGVKFDRHFIVGDEFCGNPRFKGIAKGGMYGYPHFLIMGEWGLVIYSLNNKEDIRIARFKMKELE